ncbi:MAG: hypothetical protein Q8O30_00130 [Candidatus Omnitrophota bacterium]|nr:hypothetical protein [Candidatus Omnitrophota bacterium]
MVAILVYSCLLGVNISFAAEQDANAVAEEIKNELAKQNAITVQEANAMDYHIKGILAKGVKKEDVKNIIIDFSNSGLSGNDLQGAISFANQLISDGEDPREAVNIVSRAAQEAKAQGLTGMEFNARIEEVIKQRKAIAGALKEKLKK